MKKVLLFFSLIFLLTNISYAAEKYSGIWKNQKNCSYGYGSIGPLTSKDIEIYPNGYVHFHETYSVPFSGKVYSDGKIVLEADKIGELKGTIKNDTFELKFREYTNQNIFHKMSKCNVKFVKDNTLIKQQQIIKKNETNLAFESNEQINVILELPKRFENFIKSKSTIQEKINNQGNKYIGEFKNNKYDGWGIFENKDYTYYGQFKNNKYFGLGLVKYKNNISFNLWGAATYDWSNDKLFSLAGKPTMFVGEFSGLEKLNGKGILLLNNQLIYGDWWSSIRGPWIEKEYIFSLSDLIKENSILEGLIQKENSLSPISKPKF